MQLLSSQEIIVVRELWWKFIHSFSILSENKFKASKAIPPHTAI